MKVGFIGAGKVGFTLGKYFCTHGIEVAGYCSRNIQSAREAANFTGTKVFASTFDLSDVCDVLFLTVPDMSIRSVYAGLCQRGIQNKIFCHCSGALTAEEAFPQISEAGAAGFSVHPLFAISDKYHAYGELADVFFTLEGTAGKIDLMENWLRKAGLKTKVIPPAAKIKYHCAAALASNYVLALVSLSRGLLEDCGFSADEAELALKPLFWGNARHIAEDGLQQALTGPVERGDLETVRKHLGCLSAEQGKLYCLLAKELTKVARDKHPARDYAAIAAYLESMYGKG